MVVVVTFLTDFLSSVVQGKQEKIKCSSATFEIEDVD